MPVYLDNLCGIRGPSVKARQQLLRLDFRCSLRQQRKAFQSLVAPHLAQHYVNKVGIDVQTNNEDVPDQPPARLLRIEEVPEVRHENVSCES